MTRALISSEVLVWARERAGYSLDAFAKTLRFDPKQLELWEGGENSPTFLQAAKMANKLSIPIGYLFLDSPPDLEPQIPDLRTVGSEERNHFSPEFEEVINDCLLKQYWFKEQLQYEGANRLKFIGKYTLEDKAIDVANDIRKYFDIDINVRRQSATEEEFLNLLIEKIEGIGVLVLRNGVVKNNTKKKLSVQEFRGFVLSDPVAPLIFINNNDATSAKNFTLIHELVHLWVNESGVSNLIRGHGARMKRIEKFCNSVAAEILLPTIEFVQFWNHEASLINNLNEISRRFHISRFVVLIKAFEIGRIDQYQFDETYPMLLAKSTVRKSGGNSFNTIPVRNSKKFTKALLASTLEGRTLYRDAARLLGLKNIATVTSLAAHLEIR